MGEIFNVPTGHNEWVKYRLTTVDKDIAKKVGDFDKDGEAGTIKDYADYYQKNRRAVEKQVPFFKAATAFNRIARSGDNSLIHNVMSLAASAMKPAEIAKAYASLAKAYGEVWRVVKGTNDPEKRAVAIMKALGPSFKLLTKGVTSNRKVYAEPAIFGGLIAAQMGLEGIGAVIGPKDTVYLRYEKKKGVYRYVDSTGKQFSDGELRSQLSGRVSKGTYLAKLTTTNLLGMMVLNRGYASLKKAELGKAGSKEQEGQTKDAFGDFFVSAALLGFNKPLAWKSMGNVFLTLSAKHKAMGMWTKFAYGMALVFDEGYAPALNNLGILADRKDKGLTAMMYYQAATLYEPGFPQGHLNLCDEYSKQRRFEQAIPHCTVATKHPYTAADAFIKRAHATTGARLCRKTRTTDGMFVRDLYRAIKTDPSSISGALSMLETYFMNAKTITPRTYGLVNGFLNDALRKASDPKLKAQVCTIAGMLHRKSGKNDKAVAAFKKAVSIDPKSTTAYQAWGRYYLLTTKEYGKAREKFDLAIATGNVKGRMLYNRGLARFLSGNLFAALPDFIDACKMEKRFARISFSKVAQLLDRKSLKQDELQKVRTFIGELIAIDPVRAPAYYYYRAKVNKLMGNAKAAAEDAKKASKAKPKLRP